MKRSKNTKITQKSARQKHIIGVLLLMPAALSNLLFVFGSYYFNVRTFDSFTSEAPAATVAYFVSLVFAVTGIFLLSRPNVRQQDNMRRWYLNTLKLSIISLVTFAVSPFVFAFMLLSGFCIDGGTCNYLYLNFLSIVSTTVSALPVLIPVVLLIKVAVQPSK